MARNSFIFYYSFYDAIYELPKDMQLKLYNAIMRYSFFGEEPELDAVARAVFKLVRPQIDANNKRFENGCKGADYGKKGGRPKKKSALQCNGDVTETARKKPQENPTETPNVNVNVNENANVNDTTVVVSNARAAFCKAYAVTDDDATTDGIDFDVLSKAYSASAKWLQVKPYARRMSWVVKHYAEIIAGKYTDFAEQKAPPPTTQAQNSFNVEDD